MHCRVLNCIGTGFKCCMWLQAQCCRLLLHWPLGALGPWIPKPWGGPLWGPGATPLESMEACLRSVPEGRTDGLSKENNKFICEKPLQARLITNHNIYHSMELIIHPAWSTARLWSVSHSHKKIIKKTHQLSLFLIIELSLSCPACPVLPVHNYLTIIK